MNSLSPIDYYRSAGLITDPRQYASLLDDLPTDVPALCQVIQGVLIHNFWLDRYEITLPEERKAHEVNLRSAREKLARILELHPGPLVAARPQEERLVGNCRDFSTLLTAVLRHQGVPARARCGFGTYFLPGHYEDHWVCEYWDGDEGRWVMVDPQLDALMIRVLDLKFDPRDMPAGQFVPACRAWQLCRTSQADPDHFGIFNMHGLWFVRGNLLRDIAALNKFELLPWDCWGLSDKPDSEQTADDVSLLDRAAELAAGGEESLLELRNLYEDEPRLKVPDTITSYPGPTPQRVELAYLQTA